jgi:pimeloyl-ACP methyl ester carboxylesterase
MLKKLIPLLLSLALLASACQAAPTQNPAPAPQSTAAGYTPKYEKIDCPFDKIQGVTVECGYLVVPEDRANPQGRTIKVAAARFKATQANPAADPIVYLEGGPGGSPLRSYAKNFSILFGPFNQKRDVILVDQRGTGYSQPALDCPESTQLTLEQLNQHLAPEAADQQFNQSLQACRDRLKGQGINLGAYNSAANAADLNDLRSVLGIKEWNLYGISYGTRLALTALRDTRAGIRSVVIDSVYLPQGSLVTEPPASFARSLNLVLDGCAADKDCAAAYPNLKQVLFDTVKKLNDAPAKIKITQPDLGSIGTPGKQLDALLDGDSLLGLIFQLLYSSDMLPSIPALVYMAKDGNFGAIAQLEGQFLEQEKDISRGMYFSVECVEEVPFESLEKAQAAYQAQPELAGALGPADSIFNSCKIWSVPKAADIENQPVKSDVPTLVIAGQFDPVTPPDWSKTAAATLSKSFFFEVPAAGHGPSLTVDCPQKMVLAFFDNPAAAPNSACLAQRKMTFSVPVESMTVKLGPFDSRLMGFSGLVPADWKAAGGVPGFYTPDGSMLNSTQLLMQAAPIPANQFLSLMDTQLQSSGIAILPSTQKLQVDSAGGLKWTFYEADGGLIKIDMALATSGKNTILVLLQSPWNQRQALLKAVFVPIVEAIIGQ